MSDDHLLNPYRGPFAFTRDDEKRFFGREKETEELIKLIRNCQLTILFGTSGTGKTSLIQARLLPRLVREYFHPIYLRINFDSADPLDYTRKRIVEELRKWQPDLPDFEIGQSLLNFAAKTVIFKGLVKPILFFDQFEELFTLGPKNDPDNIKQFISELSDLIELRLPDDLKNSENVYNLSNFKIVFSLRQDWVAYLEDYSHIIPSVLENRYRLKRFSAQQAFEAIYYPAKANIDHDTAKNIITEIGERALSDEVEGDRRFVDRALKNLVIDPFLLSLYCFQLYEKCVDSGEFKITSELVTNNSHEKLIRKYYDQKTNGLDNLKKLIEDGLLDESGKRLTLSLDKFTNGDKQLSHQLKDFANNTGVIRLIGETSNYEVEIVHDQLAIQIFESRIERKARDINEEAKRKEAEASTLRKSAQRAKKITMFVITIAIILMAIGVLWTNKYREDTNKDIAELKKKALSDLTVIGLKQQLNIKDSIYNIFKDSIYNVLNHSSKIKGPFQGTDSINNLKFELRKMEDSISSTIRYYTNSLLYIMKQKTSDSLRSITERKNNLDSLRDHVRSNDKPAKIQSNNTALMSRPEIIDVKIINEKNYDSSVLLNKLKKNPLTFSIKFRNLQEFSNGKIEIDVAYKIAKGVITTTQPNPISRFLYSQEAIVGVLLPEYIVKGEYSYEIFYVEKSSKTRIRLMPLKTFMVSRHKEPIRTDP